jgi:hypothetical protein
MANRIFYSLTRSLCVHFVCCTGLQDFLLRTSSSAGMDAVLTDCVEGGQASAVTIIDLKIKLKHFLKI